MNAQGMRLWGACTCTCADMYVRRYSCTQMTVFLHNSSRGTMSVLQQWPAAKALPLRLRLDDQLEDHVRQVLRVCKHYGRGADASLPPSIFNNTRNMTNTRETREERTVQTAQVQAIAKMTTLMCPLDNGGPKDRRSLPSFLAKRSCGSRIMLMNNLILAKNPSTPCCTTKLPRRLLSHEAALWHLVQCIRRRHHALDEGSNSYFHHNRWSSATSCRCAPHPLSSTILWMGSTRLRLRHYLWRRQYAAP